MPVDPDLCSRLSKEKEEEEEEVEDLCSRCLAAYHLLTQRAPGSPFSCLLICPVRKENWDISVR